MKKILFSLLMLCCMTAAWAEKTGDGSKEHPYSGEWEYNYMVSNLKEGDYLAYDCSIVNGMIYVHDTMLHNKVVFRGRDWSVSSAIGENPLPEYESYCAVNTLEERQQQVFVVTAKSVAILNTEMEISGHYIGDYGDVPEYFPYHGWWNLADFYNNVYTGDCLAYDFSASHSASSISVVVNDRKLDNTCVVEKTMSWSVADMIGENPLPAYEKYCSNNTLEERKNQVFVITDKSKYEDYWFVTTIYITGYFTGKYFKGTGTQEDPFSEEWNAEDLAVYAKEGDYIARDCEVKAGSITVEDDILGKVIVSDVSSWKMFDPIGGSYWEPYTYYCIFNPILDRFNQMFVVTSVEADENDKTRIKIKGHYSGKYESDRQGFIDIYNFDDLKTAVQLDNSAKIQLMDDIYLKDEGELCRTFKGTLDGNGYTIYAGDEDAHHDGRGLAHGKYLFTYSEGATFKNLNFKDFRADTDEHSNWSFLTSQATDGCVFENITFDHVSLWAKVDNGGAVAGYANGCTFKNITVKNGDFTVNGNNAGAVVGNAERCTFTNIKVSKNDVTADKFHAGGVAGFSSGCTFQDIEINECNITAHDRGVAGISGKSEKSRFINCKVDDQTGIFAVDHVFGGYNYAEAGGIAGWSTQDEYTDCINSALVAAHGQYTGGIVGRVERTVNIQNCVNTGMVVSISKSNAPGIYDKYKKKELAYDVKHYNGVEYNVRYLSGSQISDLVTDDMYFGGLVGGGLDLTWWGSKIENSASLGSIYVDYYSYCGIIGQCTTMKSECPMYIRNCLVDFITNKNDKVHAVHTSYEAPIYVQNCLVVNSAVNIGIPSYGTDIPLGNVAASVEEYERLYCNYTLIPNATRNGTKSSTIEEMHSGALAIKLGAAWEQNLGTDPYPTPTGNKGLYHTRNVSNQYGTACFPFSVKSDDEISYYTFNEATEGSDIKLMFKYAKDMIPAGTPVLFRAADTVDATEPVEVCFSHYGDGFTKYPNAPMFPIWGMEGTFEQKVFEGEAAKEIYYVSGGVIHNAATATINAYHAYLYGPNIDTLDVADKPIKIVIEGEEDIATELELVGNKLVPIQNGKTYSIMGTEVGNGYRGIVIRGGKKYVK